ncbi:MAG: recombinase family protein [Hyphomicrobiales bacterium]|nr:recombinase family protein [Hyphomicrobiales bacterium]
MNFIGYARVSTSGQTLDAQLEQLKAHGCDQVFRETMSGARSDRPELKKALAVLSNDDVLVVTRLDRLARSTRDLLDIGCICIKVPNPPQDLAMFEARLNGQVAAA